MVRTETRCDRAQKERKFMKRLINQIAMAAAVVCVTAGASLAQQTSTSTETKNFEVIAAYGNTLDVKLPEGTRELTVPEDFRFMVNGQSLSVHDLKPGMKGTATITTRTTVTPVTVTEVKNGTVVQRSGSTLIVRTGGDVKMFTQSEIDKRGVKIMRDGKPAELSDFREGDKLSATIITAQPPHIMTQKEVDATVPTAAARANTASPAPAARTQPAAAAPATATQSSRATTGTSSSAAAPEGQSARALPHTASSWPLVALMSLLSLAVGLTLTLT